MSLFSMGHIPAETWTDIGGVRYDVRAFLESGAHPGGNFLLRMCCGRGRDATALYLSNHALANTQLVDATLRSLPLVPFSDKSRPALHPTCATERPFSSLSSSDPFYARLIERVAGWERSVPWYVQLAAEWATVLECALAIVMVFVMRYHLLMLPLSVWSLCLRAFLYGFSAARTGFLHHQGNHSSVARLRQWSVGGSRRSRWEQRVRLAANRLVGIAVELSGGASSAIWSYSHQVSHHVHTNDAELDNDAIIGSGFLRLHPSHPMLQSSMSSNAWQRVLMRHQHWFLQFAFSLATIQWVFVDDVRYWWERRVKVVQLDSMDANLELLYILVFKLPLAVYHAVLLPYALGLPCALLVNFILFATTSQYLYQLFSLSHVMPGAHTTADSSTSSSSWAAMQAATSINWASGSHFYNWLSGGLTHQVEHHLFPTLHCSLLPLVAPLVESTCAEFGVPYHNYASLSSAWWTQKRFLDALGAEGADDGTNKQAGHIDVNQCYCVNCTPHKQS